MKQFIFLIRLSGIPLPADKLHQLKQEWGTVITQFRKEGRFVESYIFAPEGSHLTGWPNILVSEGPVVDRGLVVGAVIILLANDVAEAIELAKKSPTLHFGGMVEVRPVQPTP